jgi:hypothetical protein
MTITFGKYRGKSVEWLVLKAPDYLKWILEQPDSTCNLASVKTEALRLISLFDAKQITKPCLGSNCSKAAIQFTAYQGNPYLIYAWCDTCDPYQQGASPGKLTFIKTYRDALNYVKRDGGGRSSDYKGAIKKIAMAKGLPARSSEAQMKEFFA